MSEESVEPIDDDLDELTKSLEDAEARVEVLETQIEKLLRDGNDAISQRDSEIRSLKDQIENTLASNTASTILMRELKLLKNEKRWDLLKQLVSDECLTDEVAARKLLSQVDLLLKWYGEMKT